MCEQQVKGVEVGGGSSSAESKAVDVMNDLGAAEDRKL